MEIAKGKETIEKVVYYKIFPLLESAGIFLISTIQYRQKYRMRPAIFTVTTIIFLLNFWNEYLLASTLIADPIRRTINVAPLHQLLPKEVLDMLICLQELY